jgi:hypothetical protein
MWEPTSGSPGWGPRKVYRGPLYGVHRRGALEGVPWIVSHREDHWRGPLERVPWLESTVCGPLVGVQRRGSP